jgi:hypothetical protein
MEGDDSFQLSEQVKKDTIFLLKSVWKKVARLFKALSTHYCNNGIIVIGYKFKKYENFTTLEGWAWNS